MKPRLACLWIALLAIANSVYSAEPPAVAGHQTKTIEGWTLHIPYGIDDSSSLVLGFFFRPGRLRTS